MVRKLWPALLAEPWIIQLSFSPRTFMYYTGVVGTTLFGLGAAYYLGTVRGRGNAIPIRDPSHTDEIDQILGRFVLDEDGLRTVMSLLEDEMEKGLDPDSEADSDLKMICTHVRHLPDGTESGRIIALDLGGTNFRALEVDLLEDRAVEITSKIFLLPERLLSGHGSDLFDYLASSMATFMNSRNMGSRVRSYPLGFTFSFPCEQISLQSARLIEWTKGFHCNDVVGKDVSQLLNEAIERRTGLNVRVNALVNDTVGTLMTCAHKYSDCYIGVIFGTGTNACYVEKLDRVKKWKGKFDEPNQVIINTEWGAFGDNDCLDFIRTKYDHEVDNGSVNPGKQKFEKMISGMYMGEMARNIILDLINQQLLFPGLLTKSQKKLGYIRPLVTPGSFYSRYVSDIETDEGVSFKSTKRVLEEMGFQKPAYEDCAIVKNVCERVSFRAAQLAGAAMAVLINRVGASHVTVGVDGSLYRHHPRFKKNLETVLSKLVDRKVGYRLVLSEDGSGKGAALVAAVADRVERQSRSASNSFVSTPLRLASASWHHPNSDSSITNDVNG